MRSRKFRDKGFSTETLSQIEVEEIVKGSEGYERGEAPVGRDTQSAESLDDMAQLQRNLHGQAEMSRTHSYDALDAVRDFGPTDPEPEYEPPEYYDGEDSDNVPEPSEQFALQPLTPSDEKYDDIMDNYEEVMEKMSSSPTKPKYWFKEQGDHWFCTCGQLNKGEVCSNCGLERDILRALFFLHEPGEEAGKYEGMNVTYTDVDVRDNRLSSKAKMIIAIAVIVILGAAAGFYSYYYIIKPNMEKEAAANAKAMAESIQANVPACTKDMNEFLRNSYETAGDDSMESESYERALRFYAKADAIGDGNDLTDKVNKAKFGYVKAHANDGGEKFEKYLGELHDAGYEGVDEIYDKYYAWHFSIVANLSPDDYSTDIETASRADTVYFHVSVSGGPPGEALDIYYDATWPTGARQTDMIGSGWKSGSRGYARFSYPVPIFAQEGTLTFKIYNKSTQKELGSDSIQFKH
ncbi:MAG: hypothetical protein ACSW8G_05870 [Bacillota bacterium]